MKGNIKYIIIIAAAALILAGLLKFRQNAVILQGEVVVRQISLSPRVAGRLEEVFVKEGDYVNKGDIIAKIDSPDIMAKSRQAVAASKAAKAQQEKAYKGSRREEIDSAYSLWQKAAVGADLSEKTYNRIKELFDGGVVSLQKLDEAKASYDAAVKDKETAKSRYDMALTGAREEDKAAAAAVSEQALGVVSEVETYVKETTVVAPKDGEISSVIAEQGELVAPGLAVATMLDLNDMWISFNIREDLLKGMRMHDIIEVHIPAVDNKKHKFKVNYISKLGDFAVWSATRTRGEFDLKTFEVRAVPAENTDGLRHGMTVVLKTRK